MKVTGEVAAILNANLVLLKILESYTRVGDELTVFAKVSTDGVEGLELNELLIPKGSLRVVSSQAPGFYLAERFKSGERLEKRPFGIGGLSDFSQEVRIGGTWSARLNGDQSLNIAYSTDVATGDPVGEA